MWEGHRDDTPNREDNAKSDAVISTNNKGHAFGQKPTRIHQVHSPLHQ
jgi:hypothetical protein